MSYNFILFLLLAPVVTLLTHWLAYTENWGVVRASSVLTVLVFAISYPLSAELKQMLPPLALGASFVGFSLPKLFNRTALIQASLLYALLFSFGFKYTPGIGGALGLFAFIACLTVKFFQSMIKTFSKA